MKHDDPPRLLGKIRKDCVIFLGEDPYALVRMPAAQHQRAEHVMFFLHFCQGATIVYYVECLHTLALLIESPQIFVEAWPIVKYKNLWRLLTPPP